MPEQPPWHLKTSLLIKGRGFANASCEFRLPPLLSPMSLVCICHVSPFIRKASGEERPRIAACRGVQFFNAADFAVSFVPHAGGGRVAIPALQCTGCSSGCTRIWLVECSVATRSRRWPTVFRSAVDSFQPTFSTDRDDVPFMQSAFFVRSCPVCRAVALRDK